MQTKEVRLGICFFDSRLFYAVKSSAQKSKLEHIGAIDFNFDLSRALFANQEKAIFNLKNTLNSLCRRFNSTHLHILVNPQKECWSVLPKLVYDNAEEREAHIQILMHGIDRKNIHATWHSLSNKKFKLLNLRTERALKGIKKVTDGRANIHLQSAFEIGEAWIAHQQPGGSFLTVCCYEGCLAVSSFLLGKLRGATYIPFDHAEDLPYLWLQQSRCNKWMKGLHEQIQIFGADTSTIVDILKPLFDDSGSVAEMNSLEEMNITADEETYGFDLGQAYPAVMMVV